MKATLVFEDESGFSLVAPLKRTWARRGQTPVMRTQIGHHERLNLLGALSVLPSGKNIRLSIRSFWHSLTGMEVITFLKQILRRIPGTILLLWDRHPIHKRKIVQEFLVHNPRLLMEYFPVGAPELNPMEFAWSQVSESTAGSAPYDRTDLQRNVFTGVARTRRSSNRLQACLRGTHLDWTS